MNKVIEDLYLGKINPHETVSSCPSPHYMEQLQKICDQDKTFTESLTPNQREMYKRLENIKADVATEDYSNIFVSGFRLGARIMKEILED